MSLKKPSSVTDTYKTMKGAIATPTRPARPSVPNPDPPPMTLTLLAALSNGPKHGFRIVREIRETVGDLCSLRVGSVYPALYRLESRGYVTSKWTLGRSGGRDRRYYTITPEGRAALRSLREGWTEIVNAVNAAIAGPKA